MNGTDFLPEFDHEMASTRKVLERLPEARLDFCPHDRSWSARELAAHVANIPFWAVATLQRDGWDMEAPDDRTLPTTASEILAAFEQNAERAREALERATEEDLAAPWTLRSGERVHFTMPKAAVYRSFAMNHLIHHRAQLGVYLRLMDIPVPGLYGPSADES